MNLGHVSVPIRRFERLTPQKPPALPGIVTPTLSATVVLGDVTLTGDIALYSSNRKLWAKEIRTLADPKPARRTAKSVLLS